MKIVLHALYDKIPSFSLKKLYNLLKRYDLFGNLLKDPIDHITLHSTQ